MWLGDHPFGPGRLLLTWRKWKPFEDEYVCVSAFLSPGCSRADACTVTNEGQHVSASLERHESRCSLAQIAPISSFFLSRFSALSVLISSRRFWEKPTLDVSVNTKIHEGVRHSAQQTSNFLILELPKMVFGFPPTFPSLGKCHAKTNKQFPQCVSIPWFRPIRGEQSCPVWLPWLGPC